MALMTGGSADVEKCREVAEKLNAKFMTKEPAYDWSRERVETWMNRAGLLVGMCTTGADGTTTASCDAGMDHLSTSFMSQETTGYRVVASGFGDVLDPTKFRVRCAYPADAGTGGRDDRGCGPFSLDSEDGAKGYELSSDFRRGYFKAILQGVYRLLNVTEWTEFPCSKLSDATDYFGVLYDLSEDVPMTINSIMANWLGAFVGHPYCFDDTPPCVVQGDCGGMLAYFGPSSWSPFAISDVLDAMSKLHAKFPALMANGLNEVVLDLPDEGDDDLYQATFWVNDTIRFDTAELRSSAILRANYIGTPLLVANLPWLNDVDTSPWDGLERPDEWHSMWPIDAPWPDPNGRDPPSVVFACDEENHLASPPPPLPHEEITPTSTKDNKRNTPDLPWWSINIIIFFAIILTTLLAGILYRKKKARQATVVDHGFGYAPLHDGHDTEMPASPGRAAKKASSSHEEMKMPTFV